MSKIREILRLRWSLEMSQSEVAGSCNCSASTVARTVELGKKAGLSWPLPENWDDARLQAELYPKLPVAQRRSEPDFKQVHLQLGRKGVTLSLLWQEYRAQCPEGYGYSSFCNLYRKWRGKLEVSMRQSHKPGEKLFVDYAGQRPLVYNALTGEAKKVSIFVAALGVSQLIYAEATEDEKLPSWMKSHQNAFDFYGGVTEVLVPDNLKSAVTKPCFYDPDINRSYKELADHYGTVVLPARIRRPKDKAKVENAVLQVERWVLAPLRNQKFFSLSELNTAMGEKLDQLNSKPLTGLEQSRQELFEQTDKLELSPLPLKRFRLSEWKLNRGVNIDYHVEFEGHRYSVPYRLIRQRVDIRATDTTVECLHNGVRVAAHRRSFVKGGFSTIPEHRPKSHQEYSEWSPERLVRWAGTVGLQTARAVHAVLGAKRHPEQAYRAALGIIRLEKRFGKERLEKACARSLTLRSPCYKTISSMLKTKMEDHRLPYETSPQVAPIEHENLRGPTYYH